MITITLCPRRDLPSSFAAVGYLLSMEILDDYIQSHIERRNNGLGFHDRGNNTQIDTSHLSHGNLPLGLTPLVYSSIREPEVCPPALIPLNECILAIAWEFDDQASACNLFEVLGHQSLDSLIILLRSAALYQAQLESVRPMATLFDPSNTVSRTN
jgi:hypothetical protein